MRSRIEGDTRRQGLAGYGEDTFAPPPPGLEELVLYLWRRRFPADVEVTMQPTLPDGCIDILSVDGSAAHLVGPETVRVDHPILAGTEIVGLRLRPGVGARLFGSAAPELADAATLLSDLPGAPPFLRSTHHELDAAPDAFRPLLDAMAPRIAGAAIDDGVASGAAWLAAYPGGSIDALCRRLGWSTREVRRRFSRALGFGPKVMQRMLRFQRVLSTARLRHPPATLSRLAAACGYADQAHMTREFQAFASTTPLMLLDGPFDATVSPLFQSLDRADSSRSAPPAT